MAANIPTGSSESSAKSTERSPSEDSTARPSQNESESTFSRSTDTGRRKVVDFPPQRPAQTHSQLMNAQWSNATHGTVDELVYSSANSLRALPPDEAFTLFGDVPRTTIVVKWMRFYRYYPNIDKAIDKLRRDELKAQLKIPSGCGQKLGSFIINKFNSFKKWGYVYWDGKHNVEYSPSTDAWLSPTWDGHIERQQVSTSRDTRSPSAQRGGTKRPGSIRVQQRDKRQKSMEERSATSHITSTATFSSKPANASTQPAPLHNQRQLARNESPNYGFDDAENLDTIIVPPRQIESNNVRGRQERHSALDELAGPVDSSANHGREAPNITTTSIEAAAKSANFAQSDSPTNDGDTRTDEVGKYPSRGRDLAPDPQELSARLEAANAQSTSGMTNGSSGSGQLPPTANHMRALGPLREKEKSCIQALNESMEELKNAREEHKTLCGQYEKLEVEARDMMKIVDKNIRRQKAATAPTPIGVVEADLAVSLQAAIHDRKEDDFVRAKKEERSNLETRMAEAVEAKSKLKIGITAKKLELKKLQRDIKEILKLNARTDRFKEKVTAYWEEFKHVDGCSSSGTMSPVESVPDSVSSELDEADQLRKADESSDLSDLDF
jgi:hypothetical protein